MTETVNNPAAKRWAGRTGGLRMQRVFSTAGTHPYDEVTWERRDVVQTNWKTGETVFEQRGVEFPDFWSANASTIVTTKYFRGALGTEARETSLRQLVDRVVGTYRAAGQEHGYFATAEDAEVFEHELTWLLVHQYFSFNSPVWFNVGTASPAQVSACFILSVDDSMDSILNWYKEEGFIFKGGSGAGLNLSRIRSSKELLSSGGTASGPVSFMRGADASAGTIKSGGATRRAAKMVVLDVDHPDIEEFVETKAREEDKIRALRDAGFDMDLGGRDITSVQYQNANNSVRVTDEFMRAVEEGSSFGLRARKTGEVIEEVDARELFHKISKAAWECADPGLQYDDTINDWHTNPETGRITASNPCFPADQRVVTDRGLVRIGDLVSRAAEGESFEIFTHDLTSTEDPVDRIVSTRPVRYMVTGSNPIVLLRFSDGSRLRCTPKHRLWTANRGWVTAEDLDEADEVLRSFHFAPRPMARSALPGRALRVARHSKLAIPEKWDDELAHLLGWLVGDGCVSDDKVTLVYGSEADRTEVLPGHARLLRAMTGLDAKPSVQANGTVQLRSGKRDMAALFRGLGVNRERAAGKVVPESIFEAPEDAVLAFLRGLFDSDGCVVDDEAKGTRYVGLGSRSEGLLLGVQELLASFGIASRIYQTGARRQSFRYNRKDGSEVTYGSDGPSFDLRITGRSLREYAAQVGFTLTYKQARLTHVVDEHRSYAVRETVRLVSRTDDGFETTYNLTEPRNHSYIVGGVAVANCSEYMSLDNSSCNLASLNLLKFLRDDDTFDSERFARAVDVIITAMDISICFADFPTEAIGRTTRDYRQLGIGYANLGALLMAMGLGYDSDGGRAMAAAVTSLMTGTSYRRSAELAAVVGPYAGYPRNADAHKRVMRKHQAANDAVRTLHAADRDVHEHAAKVWADVVRLGDKHGFRNAQASVLAPTGTISFMLDADTTGIEPDFSLVKFKKLVGGGSLQIVNQTVPRALRQLGYPDEQVEAIVEYIADQGHVIDAPGLRPEHYEVFDTAMGARALAPMGHVRMMAACQPFLSGAISKCVTGETLLPTENGLVRIGSLHRGEAADTFRAEVMEVAGPEGPQKTDAFYFGGLRPVREVVLRSGHRVVGTHNHRVLAVTEGALTWKYLADLQAGDYVAQQYGTQMWSQLPARLDDFSPQAAYGSQKHVMVPTEMSEDLAFLLGAYASEGHTTRSNWTVSVTNSDEEVLERVRLAWSAEFGVTARIDRPSGKCPQVIVASKRVVEFLEYLGCGSRAREKRIPDAVLRSPREMVLAFLEGLSLDAYTTTGAQAKWAICLDAPALLDDLQAVLANLGVVHGRVSKYDPTHGKSYDEVYASGRHAQLVASLVPFPEKRKAERAAAMIQRSVSAGTSDVVPCITGRDLYQSIPASKSGRQGHSLRRGFTYLLDPRTKHPTFDSLARVAQLPGVVLPADAARVLADNIRFSPVVRVGDAGEREVYDVSVPTTHAFVGNGIVNHNTVNLPETATVEEIEDIYLQSWKLGLKATAVYRDNCKVGQPLADAKSPMSDRAVEAVKAPAVETRIEYRPTRKRLPKSRPSRTTSFTVGGAEGYMTSGSYPDDGLGEVFLKLGKQGSTLAGVMDAFSIAVSIGLQYGVPLETYVSKFTNLRFEPAGLTDDPDVRMAQSIMDYIFRRLALDYLAFEERAALGIYSAEERQRQLETGSYEAVEEEVVSEAESLRSHPAAPEASADAAAEAAAEAESSVEAAAAKPAPSSAHTSAELLEVITGTAVDSPLCFTCGTKMRPAGSCFVCEGCGSTSGCS